MSTTRFSKLQPALKSVSTSEPSTNALDAFKLVAADFLSSSLPVSLEQAYEAIETGKKGCDINVPLPRFRLKGDVKGMAKEVCEKFQPNDYLEKAEANGITIQFTFKTKTVTSLVLNQINEMTHLKARPSYGTNSLGKGKKVIVEYSSPNIAKPFHAGHLRSTIIGAFLANLYAANGWEVLKMNYLGDWGKQFGLLSVGYQKYGSAEELEKDAIKHLFDVYVKVNADARDEVTDWVNKNRAERREKGEVGVLKDGEDASRAEEEQGNAASPTHQAAREVFGRLEKDDPEAISLWQKFRDLSITKYEELYARLNVSFDVYSGESQVSREAQREAMTSLAQKGISIEDKGALIVDLEKWKMGKTIVQKRDGTSTYVSRDIAGAFERYEEYKFDKMVYVVAAQQDLYNQQLFKILDLMGAPFAKNLEHINFGMISGMSTRKGTVVFLEQILDEAKDTMHEQMKKTPDKYEQIEDPERTSDVIGMSAVKIQDMSAKRVNSYSFDWARMTSYLGDTGPYLQYAHVRISSIVRKSDISLPPPDQISDKINTDLLSEPKAREVLLLLASYPDVVKHALRQSEPTTIVSWCWKLTHAVSSAYEVLLVKGQEEDLAMARLLLYVCAKDVLASAMRLLTLTPLDRM